MERMEEMKEGIVEESKEATMESNSEAAMEYVSRSPSFVRHVKTLSLRFWAMVKRQCRVSQLVRK